MLVSPKQPGHSPPMKVPLMVNSFVVVQLYSMANCLKISCMFSTVSPLDLISSVEVGSFRSPAIFQVLQMSLLVLELMPPLRVRLTQGLHIDLALRESLRTSLRVQSPGSGRLLGQSEVVLLVLL